MANDKNTNGGNRTNSATPLKCGVLVLYANGQSWTSKFIQWITGSKYSHSALMLSETEIVDADGTNGQDGIKKFSIEEFKKKFKGGELHFFKPRKPLRIDFKKRVNNLLEDCAACPYDWIGLFSELLIINGRKPFRFLQNKDNFYCSELCHYLFQRSNSTDQLNNYLFRCNHQYSPAELLETFWFDEPFLTINLNKDAN